MAESEAKAEAKPETKASGGGGGGGLAKLVPIILIVNSVLLVGVLLAILFKPAGGAAKHEAAAAGHDAAQGKGEKAAEHAAPVAKGEGPGPTLRLPDFIVHLRDGDAERYLRISFEVEVKDDKAKEGLTARLPQIRDTFLSYLSDRSADELRGSEATNRLKNTLIGKIGEVAPGVPVLGLYVTDLIIQ
jgi:flagellar FliL protein